MNYFKFFDFYPRVTPLPEKGTNDPDGCDESAIF